MLDQFNQTQLFTIAVLAFLIFLVLLRARNPARRAPSRTFVPVTRQKSHGSSLARLFDESDLPAAFTPESLERLCVAAEVELREVTRELTARLDTKLAALQQLLVQTDAAMARLDQAIDQAEQLGVLERGEPAAARCVDKTGSGGYRREFEQSADPRFRRDASHPVVTGRLTIPTDPTDDPRFERVFALAEGGLSAAKISAQTSLQIGEVELILSLRGTTRQRG